MPKSKLGRFLDNLVLAITCSLLLFAWIKKLFKNNYLSLFLAIIVTLLIIKIINYFQNSKLRKLHIQKEELEHMKTCNFELRKMTTQEQLRFIKKLFTDIKFKQKNFTLISNNLAIISLLTQDIISVQDILASYQKVKTLKLPISELLILCTNSSSETYNCLKDFSDIKIEILTPLEIYSLMKNANYFSSEKTKKPQNKLYKVYFSSVFLQKSAKLFFKCGILLYISSLFVPYFTYYIITASILLILAIICFCFGRKDSPTPKIIESFLKKNDLKS